MSGEDNLLKLVEVDGLGTTDAVFARLLAAVEAAEAWERDGLTLPLIRLYPDSPVLALRAELALARHGLPD